MSPLDAFRIAIRAIIGNRLRSSLTLLGLVIGVSSVIALIAVGQGTQKGVTDQIRGLGTDLIFIEPSAVPGAGGAAAIVTTSLVQSDADAIAANGNPAIVAVSAHITGETQAIAGPYNVPAEVVFTSAVYAEVRDLEAASGSFITPLHDEEGELVAVLGSRVAESIFPGLDPVGQEVRLSFLAGRVIFAFTVVGVLEPIGGEGAANGQVFVPLTGLASRFRFLYTPTGDLRVTQIDVQTAAGADTEAVKQQITDLLLFRHQRADPDFTVQSQDDLLDAASEVANTLSILLGSIAGISLLVGGIGVMNIMLVSVTERTPRDRHPPRRWRDRRRHRHPVRHRSADAQPARRPRRGRDRHRRIPAGRRSDGRRAGDDHRDSGLEHRRRVRRRRRNWPAQRHLPGLARHRDRPDRRAAQRVALTQARASTAS